jgi:hypothetical protein
MGIVVVTKEEVVFVVVVLEFEQVLMKVDESVFKKIQTNFI